MLNNSTLSTDPEYGLTPEEAALRLSQYGHNTLPAEKTNLLLQFLKKFWGPSAWMLELILAVSIFLKKPDEFYVVSILLVINAVLSFILERRASGIIKSLEQRLQIRVRVLRGGKWLVIFATELVPGDVIRIRAGDFVPADARILDGVLEVDQSALTGESIDVHHEIGDKLISGSTIRNGEAKAIVELTGAHTQYGKTASLIKKASPKLHIERVVLKVVGWLFAVVLLMMLVVGILAVVREVKLNETIPILLILLMSAIPISLPVMVTVCLSIGARELSKKGILVTRLSAVEDAATMSQLCIDKTGTMTANQLSIGLVGPRAGVDEKQVIWLGAVASEVSNQDPIDLAFIVEAKNRNLFSDHQYELISFKPFNPVSRSTQAIVKINDKVSCVMKGAVASIIGVCEVDQALLQEVNSKVDEWGRQGYRVLGVAQGEEGKPLQFMGLVALFDPPRMDAKSFVDQMKDLGISLKMLTGDALIVGKALSMRLGLGEILPFTKFEKYFRDNDKSQKDLVLSCGGFAEVFPENKYLVVQHLQSFGLVTGMTGDGVNDAPALRQAEVGIAVSKATDIARSAASIVLVDDSLVSIVHLISQGRMVYQRLLTWIINKISRTFLKAPYVVIAYVVTGKFVVSAFAMLLLVLVTDLTKISLATDQVRPSSKPESWNINGYMWLAIILGVLMLVESLLFLWFGWTFYGLNLSDGALNAFSFLCLLYMGAFSILSVRERRYFWSSKPGNILLGSFLFEIIVGAIVASTGISNMSSIPWKVILSIFFYAAFSCLIVNDFIKRWIIKKFYLAY